MAHPVMLNSHDPEVILEQIKATEARLRFLRERMKEIRTLMEHSTIGQLSASHPSMPETAELTQETLSPKTHILKIAFRNEL